VGDAWWQRLAAAGFDAGQPAVVASTGVSMYLTKDAIAATLRQVAGARPGIHARHDVSAAARARGTRGASGA
jgi:O-methyltransferase involved in polyketide biosynthesis